MKRYIEHDVLQFLSYHQHLKETPITLIGLSSQLTANKRISAGEACSEKKTGNDNYCEIMNDIKATTIATNR